MILIPDSDMQTTVKVAAINQVKDYGFTAGPYDYKSPTLDPQVTSDVVAKIKEDLKLK
jgi:hypothetical protein